MIAPALAAVVLLVGSAQQDESAATVPEIYSVRAPDMVGPAYIMGERVVYVSHRGSRMHAVLPGGDSTTVLAATPARLVDREQPHRVHLYEPAGDLVRSFRLADTSTDTLAVPFAPFEADLIGIFPDGAVMSIRKVGGMPAWPGALPSGASRDSVTLELHRRNGRGSSMAHEVIARTLGDEVVWLNFRYGGFSRTAAEPVLFGHRLLVARSGHEVVVARTDLGEVRVVTRDGDEARRFPMPGEQRGVSAVQIAAERDRRVRALTGQPPPSELAEVMDVLAGMGRGISPELQGEQIAREVEKLPANEVAPSIDRLLVDADGRIWARMTPLPEDPAVLWSVHDPNGRRRFALCLPRDEELLDAKGLKVLTRVRGRQEQDLLSLKEFRAITNDACP